MLKQPHRYERRGWCIASIMEDKLREAFSTERNFRGRLREAMLELVDLEAPVEHGCLRVTWHS